MPSRKRYRLRLPTRTLELGRRTLLMGVLNVTPDSFSDGGRYFDPQAAVARALEMERAGADILDIGGESTRPGAAPVSATEELNRVLPVLQGLRGKLGVPISLDTQKAAVAEAGIAAGAEIINDVSALRSDPALGEVVRRHRVALVLMHMRGTPGTMQQGPFARDVMRDVTAGLRAALARARRAKIDRARLLLDPGVGFGKSYEQNCELLRRLPELARLGSPLVVGTSRKAFIGWLLGGREKDQSWPADKRTVGHGRHRHRVDPRRRAHRARARRGGDGAGRARRRRAGHNESQRHGWRIIAAGSEVPADAVTQQSSGRRVHGGIARGSAGRADCTASAFRSAGAHPRRCRREPASLHRGAHVSLRASQSQDHRCRREFHYARRQPAPPGQ